MTGIGACALASSQGVYQDARKQVLAKKIYPGPNYPGQYYPRPFYPGLMYPGLVSPLLLWALARKRNKQPVENYDVLIQKQTEKAKNDLTHGILGAGVAAGLAKSKIFKKAPFDLIKESPKELKEMAESAIKNIEAKGSTVSFKQAGDAVKNAGKQIKEAVTGPNIKKLVDKIKDAIKPLAEKVANATKKVINPEVIEKITRAVKNNKSLIIKVGGGALLAIIALHHAFKAGKIEQKYEQA